MSVEYKYRPDNADELRQCIKNAFANAIYPGDDKIATIPDCCTECRATDEFFRGKHWHDLAVSGQRLQFGWGGLSFLSPEAWRYYIPTYLLVGLSQSEYAEEASWWALIALSPSQTADLADHFEERACGFSVAQQECIAAYAFAFSDLQPEDETYESVAKYWEDKAAETRAKQGAV